MVRIFRVLAFIVSLSLASAAAAQGHRATSPHFEIYADDGAADLRAQAERLERIDAGLRLVSGINPEQEGRPITVFFVRDVAMIQRMLGPAYRTGAGFYSPRTSGSLIVAPSHTPWTNEGAMTPETILLHEYAHHFLLQNFAAAYPPWFVEGFAEFYATATVNADGSATIGNVPLFRVPSLRSSSDVTAQDLLTTGLLDPRSRSLEQFYARSWLLVHYLTFSQTRTGQRARYIKAIEQGLPLEAAAKSAFGDLRALNGELRRYMDSPLKTATIGATALAVPAITVAPLTPAQAALVPLRIEWMRGVADDRRAAFAAAVRTATAGYPADPDALLLRAEAEGNAGNYKESERAADALLALAPNHSRALLRKAKNLEALDASGGRIAARPLIVRANRSDPRDPLPLVAYYRSFRAMGAKAPSQVALDGLLLAVQLAPQSGDLRLVAGAALLKAEQLDAAEHVLRPAAYAPHGGATAEQAQALLTSLGAARASASSMPAAVSAAERILVERLDPA
jgi:tetratricopeptide (TPR) repeat protein